MIEIFASASIGAIVGFGVCAALTAGKVADASQSYQEENDFANLNRAAKDEALLAHARCADALNTAQSRIERALGCVTENSAHVGRKMAAILKGEQ